MKNKNLLKFVWVTLVMLLVYALNTSTANANEITIDGSVNASSESQKGRSLVWTTPTIGYFFYVDVTTNDLVYVKTSNGGRTWGSIVNVNTGSVTKVSVWYDKWTTGDTGTKIHIAYLETTTASANSINYRDLDTSSDTLGTNTTINAFGAGTGSWLYTESEVSVTKARGGNLYIAAAVAAGSHDFYRCTGTCNTGGNWTSRAAVFESSVTDGVILMPGGETDNQDILAIYWDYSADEISLKTYDDSGNSVSETSISTGMVENSTYGVQWSAVQRHNDNHVILAAWNALDSATADLKSWDITNSSTITAKTDIVTDQAETAMISLMINQSDNTIYASYIEGDTFTATIDAVYKLSVSGGATWSAQAQFSITEDDLRWVDAGSSITTETGRFQPIWQNDDLNDMITSYAYIWDGGGGDSNWNTAANWLTDTAPSTSSDWLVFSSVSSKSATLNTSVDVAGIHILPWYSGTIIQSGSNTIGLWDIGFNQNSGVFSGGSGDITLNNSSISNFSQAGGIFQSTSGTMTIGGYFTHTGGIFSQTQGTVMIYPPDGTYFEISGNPTFNNLTFYSDACCNGPFGIGLNTGISTVSGTLTFDNQGSRKDTHLYDVGGEIHAKGNIVTLNAGWEGDGDIVINGTGSQSITGQVSPAAGDARFPAIEIAKSQGTLTLTNTFRVYSGWTYTQGTLATTGSTVIFAVDDEISDNFFASGTHTLNNLTIEWGNCCNTRSVEFLSGTLTVAGDTNITYDGTPNGSGMYGPGILAVQGDLTFASGLSLDFGDLGITFSGSENQIVTVNTGNNIPSGNWTVNKSTGTVSLATDIILDDTGQDLLISSGTLDIAGFSLTLDDQFALGASGTFKLQGGETTVPTLDTVTAGSTVEYSGDGTYSSLKAGNTYSNLTVSGVGSFTPSANVTVGGTFLQTAGTFNVAPSGMTVSRNFTRSGGSFVPGSSTVTFDNSGYTSTISGTTTFYNLTSITAGKIIGFTNGTTTTVSNALTLRGGATGLLTLESTNPGSQWNINVNGTATLAKLDVSDSNACGGSTKPLTTTGSLDNGGNSCWSISGGFTDWYNSNWRKRRSIVIDHTKVESDFTDFPVLISIPSDASLASLAQDDGDDILFTLEDGSTKLSHEIEGFNGTTGEIQAWVKIPSLSSTENTTIYMYYNNSDATNQQDVESVWDTNFRTVQHMEETGTCATTFTDSTSRNNDGTCNDTPVNIDGQIGDARDFDGTEYISIMDSNNDFDVSTYTISAWINRDTDNGNDQTITDIDSDEVQFYSTNSNGLRVWGFCGNPNPQTADDIFTNGSWTHVVLSVGGGNGIIYVNGQPAATNSCSGTIAANAFTIGGNTGDSQNFDGKIDEVKFSNTVRSAQWIETEYNNQSSPSTFFTISQEANAPITSVRGGVRFLPGARIVGD